MDGQGADEVDVFELFGADAVEGEGVVVAGAEAVDGEPAVGAALGGADELVGVAEGFVLRDEDDGVAGGTGDGTGGAAGFGFVDDAVGEGRVGDFDCFGGDVAVCRRCGGGGAGWSFFWDIAKMRVNEG